MSHTQDPATVGAAGTIDTPALRGQPIAHDQARALLRHVMGLVAVTVGFTALGAYLGRDLSGATGLLLVLDGGATGAEPGDDPQPHPKRPRQARCRRTGVRGRQGHARGADPVIRRRRSGREGVAVGAGQCGGQLPAGPDPELGEDVVQMPLHGPRAQEQPRCYLRVRQALTG